MFYAKIEKEKMIFRQISAKSSLKINVYWDVLYHMPLSWLVSIKKDKSCIEHYFFLITFIYEILEILENISANKDSMIGGLKRVSDQYKPY